MWKRTEVRCSGESNDVNGGNARGGNRNARGGNDHVEKNGGNAREAALWREQRMRLSQGRQHNNNFNNNFFNGVTERTGTSCGPWHAVKYIQVYSENDELSMLIMWKRTEMLVLVQHRTRGTSRPNRMDNMIIQDVATRTT